jgi:spore germination protein KC
VKAVRLLLAAVLIGLLGTGCWNRREMNELGIVSATSVDRTPEGQWIVSYQVIIPRSTDVQIGGPGGDQAPVTVFSSKGRTLMEAVQNTKREAPRSLFFAHNRVVVVSDKVAQQGMSQIVDFFIRQYDRRETTNIVLYSGKARQILEILTPLENISGIAMFYLLNGRGDVPSNIIPANMHEFIYQMTNPTANAMLPEIKVSGKREDQISQNALKQSSSSAVIKLNRVGVFKEDKLMGWLSREESLGLAWVTNTGSLRNSVIVFPCSRDSKEEAGLLGSYLVKRVQTRVTPQLSGDQINVQVEIEAEGSVQEAACKLELKTQEELSLLEEQIEGQIVDSVTRAFEAGKKMKADVLGLGMAFRQKLFPAAGMAGNKPIPLDALKLSVNARAKITNTGMSKDSIMSTVEGK